MTKLACNTSTHKHCPRCKTVKLRTEFYRAKHGHDGLQSICKPCCIIAVREYHRKDPKRHAAYNTQWDQKNPERKKDRALKTRLGVPYGTYAAMLAAQNGKCAICQAPKPTPGYARFSVDHCAETSIIRGLLCNPCNTGIGQLQHSETLLLAAIEYLKSFPGLPEGAVERRS